METILVSIVSMALIIISTLTVTATTLRSASRMADAWKTMEDKSINVRNTDIHALPPAEYSGGLIELTVQNEGDVNLSDFAFWDVIIQDQSGDSTYLSLATTCPPGPGDWAISSITVTDRRPEVFDPGILNPGEMMIVLMNPAHEIDTGEMMRIIVSTPNGVTSQCYITRQ